jgi:hypothetical protein
VRPTRYFDNAALPTTMQCSLLHVNLSFSHLLKIRVYPVSRFQLSLNSCFCKFFFRNPFSIFSDKKHPIALVKLPVSIELRISPGFFKCPRVRPCECGCIHEDTLYPHPVWCNLTFQRMDGASVDVWLYFPGIKVGQN